MGIVLDRLRERKLLLSDGAWGTMLQSAGLLPGDCPEKWNLEHSAEVGRVARAYVDAGSDLILSNTFGGNRLKLAKYGLDGETAAINRAGAELSLAAAGGRAVVAASVGPTGEFLDPYGDISEEEMFDVYREQIQALVSGGVRAVCVETMTAVEEAVVAVRAAKAVDGGLDVLCTLTFDPVPDGYRTMMGVTCRRAVEELSAAGADAVGANCGNGIDRMVEVARELRRWTALPLVVHANAGLPRLEGGKTVFKEAPEDMAGRVADLVEAGASVVGGCCGTTDAHIRAMGSELEKLR